MDAHQKVLFVDAATGYYRVSRFPLGDFYGPTPQTTRSCSAASFG
jgi:hypothetical protein